MMEVGSKNSEDSRLATVNVKEVLWWFAVRISGNHQSWVSEKVKGQEVRTGSLGLSNLLYRTGKMYAGNGKIPTSEVKVE